MHAEIEKKGQCAHTHTHYLACMRAHSYTQLKFLKSVNVCACISACVHMCERVKKERNIEGKEKSCTRLFRSTKGMCDSIEI